MQHRNWTGDLFSYMTCLNEQIASKEYHNKQTDYSKNN